eukprot:TRINITY_DN6048_c0_g1_i1.p1 TRINITY_DN6048_c0_g1~~TRINITY_DN6048_c0_g1_i1.p1  ORF type:complete len:318 (-),score=97.39 TRINITY_DN6048_c0_g1_i1:36-989(-)
MNFQRLFNSFFICSLFITLAYSQTAPSACNQTISQIGPLSVSKMDTIDILHNLPIAVIEWVSGSSAFYNLTVTTSDPSFFKNRLTFSSSTSGSSLSAILYVNLKGLGAAVATNVTSGSKSNGINLSLALLCIFSLGIFFSSSMSSSKRILVFLAIFALFCAVVKAQTNCTTMKLKVVVPSTIHNVCENGACKCAPGWSGSDCNTAVPTITTSAAASGSQTAPSSQTSQTSQASTNAPTPTRTRVTPTQAPTEAPAQPTTPPVVEPTDPPVTEAPTEAPVEPPTEAPVTEAPVTEAPVTDAPQPDPEDPPGPKGPKRP